MSGCRPDHACCHEARALKSEKAALELEVPPLPLPEDGLGPELDLEQSKLEGLFFAFHQESKHKWLPSECKEWPCPEIRERIRALESEKAALGARVNDLEELNAGNVADFLNELNDFKLRAEKAEAELAKLVAAMAEARIEIESDSRYRPDEPAQVQVNAPLTLVQVAMEAKIQLLDFLKRVAGRESATRRQPERAGQDTPARSGVGATAAAAKPAARPFYRRVSLEKRADDERECAG